MPMVTYQTFTSIAFDVADDKGASFDGIEDGGEFIRQIAAVWNSDKEQYRQMTEDQARATLKGMVSA